MCKDDGFYVVARGKCTGIFDDWLHAKALIRVKPDPVHKKYPTWARARDAYNGAYQRDEVRIIDENGNEYPGNPPPPREGPSEDPCPSCGYLHCSTQQASSGQSASAPPRMGTGPRPSGSGGGGQHSSPPHGPRSFHSRDGQSHNPAPQPGYRRGQPAGATPSGGVQEEYIFVNLGDIDNQPPPRRGKSNSQPPLGTPRTPRTAPPYGRTPATSAPPETTGLERGKLSTPPATPAGDRRRTSTSSSNDSDSSPSTCATHVEPGPPTPPLSRPPTPESESDHAFDPRLSSPDTDVTHVGPPRPRVRPPSAPSSPSRRKTPARSNAGQDSDADIESDSDLPSHETLPSIPRPATRSRGPIESGGARSPMARPSQQDTDSARASPRLARTRAVPPAGSRSSPRLAAMSAKKIGHATEEVVKKEEPISSISFPSPLHSSPSGLTRAAEARRDSPSVRGSPSRSGQSRLQAIKPEDASPALGARDKGKGKEQPEEELSDDSQTIDLTLSDDDMYLIPEAISPSNPVVQGPVVSEEEEYSSDSLDFYFTPPSSIVELPPAPSPVDVPSPAMQSSHAEDMPVPASVTKSSRSSRSEYSSTNLQRSRTEGAVDAFKMPARFRAGGPTSPTRATPLRRPRTDQADDVLRTDLLSPRQIPLPTSPASGQNQTPLPCPSPSRITSSYSPPKTSRVRSSAYPNLSDLESPMTHLSHLQSSYRESGEYIVGTDPRSPFSPKTMIPGHIRERSR